MPNPGRAPRVVTCPTCGNGVEWTSASTYRPFCSKRCKLVDLGQWASESYRVPSDERPDDPGSVPEQGT